MDRVNLYGFALEHLPDELWLISIVIGNSVRAYLANTRDL
jgi:hypothetical protein